MTNEKISRRDILRATAMGACAIALLPRLDGKLRAQTAQPATASRVLRAKVTPKAIIFDTFGTVVDWRGSVIADGEEWGKAKGIQIDWARFADRWREQYHPSMDKVRKGQLPWTNLDALNMMALEKNLEEFHITGVTQEEKDRWNHIWHRLKPWPDSVAGLTRLKKKYIISPLSNGNVALLTNMGKFAGLPWDVILSAELFHHYKPDHETYLMAAAMLELKPEEVMLGAAHRFDLDAARECGLRTGFIYRPKEFGTPAEADKAKPGDYDVVATSIIDMAAQLGV